MKKPRVTVRFKNANWMHDLKEAAMNTVNKTAQEGKGITPELFRKYLISEHSPIRGIELRICIFDILATTSVHFARHVHSIPYVTTNRPDRRNKERSINDKVNHMMDINCQGLIDMMRKRLCVGKCAPDTYKVALAIKKAFTSSDDIYMQVIGEVLVPNCVYRAGCPEFSNCGLEKKVVGSSNVSVADRYYWYNELMLGDLKKTISTEA